MGVDFYNCDICNEIYGDCVGGSCEHCYASWCGECDKTISIFHFGEHIRCDVCFSIDPPKITDEILLNYLLKSVGKTKTVVVAEMRKLPKYSKPQNEYCCTFEEEAHDAVCGGKDCDRIMDDYYDKEMERYATAFRRGWCCVAQGAKELCDACKIKAESSNKKLKVGE